jgi:hypothetical protein
MAQGAAAAASVRRANHFSFSGGGIHVDYLESGINGRPQLNYHDRNIAKSFSGDEITTNPGTPLGSLVTVTLRFVVDVSSTTFTVLIPDTTVNSGGSASITTEGVTTLHKTPFALPQANLGQHDIYTVTRLRGTANFVQT